jgi:hypothetical protein
MPCRYVDFKPHPPGMPVALQTRAVWLLIGTAIDEMPRTPSRAFCSLAACADE